MADRNRDDRDTNYFRESYGSQDASRYRNDERGQYGNGQQGTRSSGYGDDSDTRRGYMGYEGRDYADRYSDRGDRTVQGSGAQGRNWAERAGDEMKSWVGDDEAERRRQQDRQQMGRYPGEDRGENRSGGSDRPGSGDAFGGRAYGGSSSNYGGGSYAGRDHGYDGNDRTVQGSGASGRNWAERTGDEVKSWVGDRDAEQSREQDARQMGRYPGEQPGARQSSGAYGSSSYGRGDYGSAGYSQNQGYGGRTSPTVTYSDDYQRGSTTDSGGYGARSSSYSPSSYSAYDDRSNRMPTATNDYNPDERGFLSKATDEVKSWFGNDEAERRREMDGSRDDAQQAFSGSSTAGYGYTGSTAASNLQSSTPHDPHYAAYRQARMDEYDRDYHEYKQSKQEDFHNDFHSYRTNKASGTGTTATAAAATGAVAGATASGMTSGVQSKIKEHMVVDGSDGQGVGKVDHVTGTDIKLTKHDSTDNKHHLIPLSWVASVEGDKVKLSKTSEQAMREWRVADEPAKTQA